MKPAVIVAVLVANVILPKFPVVAPEKSELPPVPLPAVNNMADLYRLRDRLRSDLDQYPTGAVVTRSGMGTAPVATLNQLWALNHRLREEEQAYGLRQRATREAAAAIALGDPATVSPATLSIAYTHWDEALTALEQIPPGTFGAAQTVGQRQQYQQQRAIAAYHYDTARSGFLRPIVDQAGLAQRVRLTVCNLQRECRRWQGDRPPASPASLIKVPIAIALMTHLHKSGLSPNTPLTIDPSNWTEDAGSLWVRAEYPLAVIMADMVSASGNIATNQLIDYLGWNGIHRQLQQGGYTTTRVTSKLVGAATYPANPGNTPNVTTTDEVTDMMVAVYNEEIPGAKLIQAALADQVDLALGHAAVAPPITWLGEKTGRNSRVLGTTTAISLHGKRYIVTATLDHSGNEAALRAILAGVTQHLLAHNGFEPKGSTNAMALARPKTFLP